MHRTLLVLPLTMFIACGDAATTSTGETESGTETSTGSTATTGDTTGTTDDPTASTSMATTSTPSTTDDTTDGPTTTEAPTTDDSDPTEPTTDPSTTDPSETGTTTDDPFLCPADPPQVELPRTGITADDIAVLVNLDDPQSVAIAEYYVANRQIPEANVVELAFATNTTMSPEVFADVQTELDAMLAPDVQALAITWTRPYRVGCMSATAAFALGFDEIYCNTSGMVCGETAAVDYYNSDSTRPAADHNLRPAMMLAAANSEDAFALIDRGIAADKTFPMGDGYMIRTTDVARSVRWPGFVQTVDLFDHPGGLDLTYIDNSMGPPADNALVDTENVLFYLTGLANVPQISSNTFVPGALADHLTSYGGQVPDSSQMSVVRWLEAGATASYGTVVEPCNYPTKFPDPTVLVPQYFRGATAIEAYWKSVAWPGEGNFVGEPLAAPWGHHEIVYEDCMLNISTTHLKPGVSYRVEQAFDPEGPWEPTLEGISVENYEAIELMVDPVDAPYYRLIAE